MKVYRKFVFLLLTLCLTLSFGTAVLAADYSGDAVVPGLSGILPGDKLTLPEDTTWATLTAVWGVRVKFLDWNDNEVKSVVVKEGESTGVPTAPTRMGYTFTGWERIDENSGTADFNDSTVTNVCGPGPIVYKAKYQGKLAAGQTTGTVTVINTTHNKHYAGYKILDAEINPDNIDAIIYTIREDSPWVEFVQDYFDLTEVREVSGGDGPVKVYQATPKAGYDPKTAFEDLLENLPTGVTPVLEEKTPDRDGVITWENVPFGYYAITSTLGSWVTVNTNNPSAKLIDKNQTAILDKNIIEGVDKVETNSASFGDRVKFEIDLTAGDFNLNELVTYYHIKDTIGDGFDYDFTSGNVTVKVVGTQNVIDGEAPYEITLSPVTSLAELETAKSGYFFDYTAGERSFELVVKWATLDGEGNLMPVYEDEFNDLFITYNATVNGEAVIAGEGNPNAAFFWFDKTDHFDAENPPTEEPTPDENPGEMSEPKTTTTYVYALGIEKVDAADDTKHLPCVKFKSTDFRAKKLSDGVYAVIADDDPSSAAAYFEVPASGFILIKGLAAGSYTFTEIETLPGYNLLPAPFTVEISAGTATTGTIAETPCAISKIQNAAGSELPSTGGIGTKLFITFGMIAVLAAGVFLVTNRRFSKEEI